MDTDTGSMPCPACGAEIKSAARVCRFCGAAVAAQAPQAPEPQAQPVMPPPPPPPPATAVAVMDGPPPADFVMRRGYGLGVAINPRFRIERGTVTFAVDLLSAEGRSKRWLWLAPMLVLMVAVIAVALMAPVLGTDQPPDWWGPALAVTFLLFLVSAVVGAIGQTTNVKHNSETHSTTFPVSSVASANLAFDWDTGCGLIILLSLIGLVIMLAMGKRVVKITAPLLPEKGMRPYRFIARSAADARALVDLLAMWRSAAPPSM